MIGLVVALSFVLGAVVGAGLLAFFYVRASSTERFTRAFFRGFAQRATPERRAILLSVLAENGWIHLPPPPHYCDCGVTPHRADCHISLTEQGWIRSGINPIPIKGGKS